MDMAQDLWKAWLARGARASRAVTELESEQSPSRTFSGPALTETAASLAGQWTGIRRGDLVALAMPNRADWISAFLALQKLGAVPVLLDAWLPVSGRAAAAAAHRCAFLLTNNQPVPILPGTPRHPSLACVKTTSGTTGTGTAVRCRVDHLVADGTQVMSTMGIRREDRQLGLIPFGHSYALGNLIMPLILRGIPVWCAESFTPAQIPDWVRRHRLTVFPTVPAVLRFLTESPSVRSLKPLRLVISAGAPLPPELARAFYEKFHIPVHNFYGASETGGICYDRTGRAGMTGRGIGKPMRGVTITLARGGRVRVAGAAVTGRRGSRLLPDLGAWNKYSELVILGRAGQVANIGGKKVPPAEIDRALCGIPGVADSWTTIQRDGRRERLATVAETDMPADQLRALLAGILPAWKIPALITTVCTLPRTCRGKPDRSALMRLLQKPVR